MDIKKKSSPNKKDSKTEKKQFWSKKAGMARKHMQIAKRTNNVGWQKMLKKRLTKYHNNMESKLLSFKDYFLI